MTNDDRSSDKPILPGATIGMLGSGQLGRMTAMAAKHMGYRVHVFSPDKDSPAGQVADLEIQAQYSDIDAVEAFAKQVDVVTLEFENLPVATLTAAGRHALVRPGVKTLATAQNRSLEKNFLKQHNIPTCRFEIVRSLDELIVAAESMLPAILKTTTDGYDGKGQVVIREKSELESAWKTLDREEAILEAFVNYDFEFSIVAARNPAGQFAAYSAITNEHQNQILDISYSPSNLSDELNAAAVETVSRIMQELDTVGVLCVEFFCCRGEALVNEIAPRPHNSGHLTIEAHTTSQFEQQVRAVCGLPLGSTRQKMPAAMANLLGQQWNNGEPKWDQALAMPSVKVHLYGKDRAELDRKMGHLVALAPTIEQSREDVAAARELLGFSSQSASDVRSAGPTHVV